LRLNGDLVVYTNKVRILGMIVDNLLSFRDQASNNIRKRVKFALSRLWHYADVTPVLTLKRLVQSLIMPYFLFCDVIYSHTSLAELMVNLMSHLILVLATYTVCRDFRAFRLTHVGFWASCLMIISIFA
jgi:hypothetical protein